MASWLTALSDIDREAVPASELYGGEHWRAVLQLNRAPDVATWVCSAGYGLVPLEAPLCAYGATFSAGHADSVTGSVASSEQSRAWWEALSGWAGPIPDAQRTLGALAERASGSVVVAMSPPYLDATRDDLRLAAKQLGDRLVVIAVGARAGASDDDVPIVATDGRMRQLLGGSMQSVNVRIAEYLISNCGHELTHPAADELMRATLATLAPLPRYERTSLTDDEVVEFIAAALAEEPTVSCTRLHRELRDSGHACEQRRFRRLFHDTREIDG
jgi:hypothetical protein